MREEDMMGMALLPFVVGNQHDVLNDSYADRIKNEPKAKSEKGK